MNGDTRVNPNQMGDAFWNNILQNFNNTEAINDFSILQNIASQFSYIHPDKCTLKYGVTEGNDFDNHSKMPNSGNKCTGDYQRLCRFKNIVNNYQYIWDKLDNREKNFVHTCTQGGYMDTLGLFFLNRLENKSMVQ